MAIRAISFQKIKPVEDFEAAYKVVKTPVKKTKQEAKRIPATIDDADCSLVIDNDELDLSSKRISVDTETTGLRVRFNDMPWMISMADQEGNSWCCMWPVDPFTRIVHYKKDDYWHYLKSVVEDPTIVKVYFNAKYDMRMLKKIGITHKGVYEEVSLKARVFNTDEFAYKLKPLSRKYCGLVSDEEDALKKLIQKLQRKAKAAEWMVFSNVETTNSKAKEDKAAPDYWLCMYAHLLPGITTEEIENAKSLAEEYCRKDTLRTTLLDDFYSEEFIKVPSLAKTYAQELELMELVIDMEDYGIRTFKDVAIRERAICLQESEQLLAELREECGDPNFLPDSPSAVAKYLFSPKPYGLGLPPTEKTKTGQYKTGYKEIEKFTYNPWVQKLFACKAKNKAVSLFFDKYIDNLIERDGYHVIHPEINQSNTKTFRFSMSNPNLQQAANPDSSARGADVIQVRNAFGPRPGYVWWLFDYSGQELRLLGGLMRIERILKAVENGEDIPTVLGNETWGGKNNPAAILQAIDSLEFNHEHPSNNDVAEFWTKIGFSSRDNKSMQERQIFADQVLRDFKYDIVKLEKAVGKKTVRTRTKMCLYGKAYGAGVNGVVGLLRCTPEDAGKWLKALDTRFPEMRLEANKWINKASKDGYIENAYGRRLTVPSDRPYVATNYKIQGTAADMMKISMVRCNKFLKSTGLDAHIILTVHDELIFEIKTEHSKKWVLRKLKELMEDHHEQVGIPMSVGISKVTSSWDIEEDFDHLFAVA